MLVVLLAWGLFFGIEPDEVGVPRCPTTTPVLLAGQAVPGRGVRAVRRGGARQLGGSMQTSVTDDRLSMTVEPPEPTARPAR